jgi:hypothetical protein
MQLVIEGLTAAGPNAATTDRKERRAKAKKRAKTLAEGRKEGAAFAAPPTSPDSQSSGGEREDGSYSEPNGSQQGAEDEASEGKEDIADGRVNDEQEAEVEVSAERDVDEGAEDAQDMIDA